jgi:hypothetical protein
LKAFRVYVDLFNIQMAHVAAWSEINLVLWYA